VSQDFETNRIEIRIGEENIVGVIRIPFGDGPFPAIVILGPLTSVKEQVPGNYANALAKRGFVTLAIDNRHFGESDGEPRFFENPAKKVEDIRAALTWLENHPKVDPQRLAAIGVCAGAGYISAAVAEDPRIKAFGTVAGFFHDAQKQREWLGEGFSDAMDRAAKAREHFEMTGQVHEIPAVGLEGEVAMAMQEAYEYYGTERGAHTNYQNRFALMSREHTLTWDSQSRASQITQPTLMIHSEKALAPFLARQFFQNLAGPKQELWMDSKGQIDFYDESEMIEPAADALAAHFRGALSP